MSDIAGIYEVDIVTGTRTFIGEQDCERDWANAAVVCTVVRESGEDRCAFLSIFDSMTFYYRYWFDR